MGGGTEYTSASYRAVTGLSPRGRGNHPDVIVRNCSNRSIPAWAGEPAIRSNKPHLSPVYPRVGGGTSGSSNPRHPVDGLSPRGRGNPSDAHRPAAGGRSIPAWAGEPQVAVHSAIQSAVYPRVGGGTAEPLGVLWLVAGLSPRGRGNPPLDRLPVLPVRSIPAWAGEPAPTMRTPTSISVYPRVGGGTLSGPVTTPVSKGLSPRGRGNPSGMGLTIMTPRSIPAWAGEPPSSTRWAPSSPVYPRVGGGTGSSIEYRHVRGGLSPRGRGNLLLPVHGRRLGGSIPAWAGEPLPTLY